LSKVIWKYPYHHPIKWIRLLRALASPRQLQTCASTQLQIRYIGTAAPHTAHSRYTSQEDKVMAPVPVKSVHSRGKSAPCMHPVYHKIPSLVSHEFVMLTGSVVFAGLIVVINIYTQITLCTVAGTYTHGVYVPRAYNIKACRYMPSVL